jgi:ADP-heptose:LPS heptosyltransferase
MSNSADLRILITRLSAIGDCVLTAPVACAVRDRFPNAFLAWTVEERAAPLLTGHRALDELIVLPRGWLKSPTTWMALRRKLRAYCFDVSIDPQSLAKSAVVARLSGAARRIGFAGPDGRELSTWMNNELVQRTRSHMVDRQLELLRPLGIERPTVRFDLPRDERADRVVDDYLASASIERFALLNVGAGWPSRRWPAERYGGVARFLGQRFALTSLVVWSGAAEHEGAVACAGEADGHARVLPRTSLLELASLARRASIFVGSDTGPLHIAAAVGTPCVALHGPTLPQVSGPYGPGHVALQAFYQGGSHRARRKADDRAMRAIEVAGVCDVCQQVLLRNPSSRGRAA